MLKNLTPFSAMKHGGAKATVSGMRELASLYKQKRKAEDASDADVSFKRCE